MTDDLQAKGSIDGIRGPNDPPSADQDRQTAGEQDQISHAAKRGKLSSKSLQIEATDRLIKHHADECIRLHDHNCILQGKLDDIIPKYSALEQAMRGVTLSLIVGPVMMGVGGGAVSFAPLMTSLSATTQSLIGGTGLGALVCGGVMLLATLYSKALIPRLRNK